MRSWFFWGLAFAVIAGYIGTLVLTNEPDLVDPGSVSVSELKALMPLEALPPGYEPKAEGGGRQPWGMPGEDTWKATYAERLFQNEAGSRIAIRINVTGTPTRGRYAGSYDALCSPAWPDSRCDPQNSAYRYLPAQQSMMVAGAASVRECYNDLCGLTATRVVPNTRNETFVRAGILVTVSVEAAPGRPLPEVGELLKALDQRVSRLATARGVDLSAMASNAKK
jgi:hypothetical protein